MAALNTYSDCASILIQQQQHIKKSFGERFTAALNRSSLSLSSQSGAIFNNSSEWGSILQQHIKKSFGERFTAALNRSSLSLSSQSGAIFNNSSEWGSILIQQQQHIKKPETAAFAIKIGSSLSPSSQIGANNTKTFGDRSFKLHSIRYSNSGTRVPVRVKWERPKENFMKCNSDASWDSSNDQWIAAAIVRGPDGKYTAATALRLVEESVLLSQSDVEYAELHGVLIGVKLMAASEHIWIETDNLTNARCIKHMLQAKPYGYLTKVLEQKASWAAWQNLLGELEMVLKGKTVIVSHVYREGNTAADLLSRMSNIVKDEQVVYTSGDPESKSIPQSLSQCIQDDLDGKCRIRYVKAGQRKPLV